VEIDYDYCKGCGICANECPAKAIAMVEEGVG
jgi:Pyruvate/2-oxoacid:ferredoxin oxidoreductase delta subunit